MREPALEVVCTSGECAEKQSMAGVCVFDHAPIFVVRFANNLDSWEEIFHVAFY